MTVDATTWGPQANGFVCPVQAEILEDIETKQHAYIAADFDNAPDTPDGQNNGIFSLHLAYAWEALRAMSASRSRDQAEGDALVQQGILTGTTKGGPTTTKVVCICVLEAGTLLEAGVSMASVSGKPDVLFTPTANYTAATSGSFNVTFEALETGPIPCPAGQLIDIKTPTTGWGSIFNPGVGVLGSAGATEHEFRVAQVQDLTRAGSNTARAIAVDLEQVPGVLSASVLENYTDEVSAEGVPPHSIEDVLYLDGTQDPAALGKAIWEAKPAGCGTAGTNSITFTDPDGGATRTVYYTPITERPVYLEYQFTKTAGYVGDSAVKTYLVDQLTTRATVGADVVALVAKSLPLGLTGVADVVYFTLGLAASPSGTGNVSIDVREIATFDTARIVVY
jgi:hypothetical protein